MKLNKKMMIQLYSTMKKIRIFEEKVAELFANNKLPGFVHLSVGQEAMAAGVCAALKKTDYITSTHRGHGHLIAKGGEVKLEMAELFGRKTGYCKGKGGSMHIADLDLGVLGANGIVGGGLPIAAGAAFAAKYQGLDAVTVCFFGDGASSQGTTHEAMNLAVIWSLPVIFVCENNGYGEYTSQSRYTVTKDIADRAAAYDMPGVTVDGNDVVAVLEATTEAVKRARAGQGPTLIEGKTYRTRGHQEGDPQTYRTNQEVEEWLAKDPISRFKEKLLKTKAATEAEIEAIDAALKQEMAEAVKFAEESPWPDPSDLTKDVYTL